MLVGCCHCGQSTAGIQAGPRVGRQEHHTPSCRLHPAWHARDGPFDRPDPMHPATVRRARPTSLTLRTHATARIEPTLAPPIYAAPSPRLFLPQRPTTRARSIAAVPWRRPVPRYVARVRIGADSLQVQQHQGSPAASDRSRRVCVNLDDATPEITG